MGLDSQPVVATGSVLEAALLTHMGHVGLGDLFGHRFHERTALRPGEGLAVLLELGDNDRQVRLPRWFCHVGWSTVPPCA